MLFPKTVHPNSVRIPQLVTIPYSHYCEVARWALEKANIEFEEVKYAPGLHAKPVGILRKNRDDRSDTSYVGQESGMHGGRRKYAVPLLCMPGGTILRDSWEILEHAMGEPDPDWKAIMDVELGVAVRQIAYFYLLTPEGKTHIKQMLNNCSMYERFMWRFIGDKVMNGMQKFMAITPENAKESQESVLRTLKQAGETLSERGSLDPSGTFGATDLAFCSLAALCVVPPNYGNGAADLPKINTFAPAFQDFIAECRQTDAGQFVLQSYDTHRA